MGLSFEERWPRVAPGKFGHRPQRPPVADHVAHVPDASDDGGSHRSHDERPPVLPQPMAVQGEPDHEDCERQRSNRRLGPDAQCRREECRVPAGRVAAWKPPRALPPSPATPTRGGRSRRSQLLH